MNKPLKIKEIKTTARESNLTDLVKKNLRFEKTFTEDILYLTNDDKIKIKGHPFLTYYASYLYEEFFGYSTQRDTSKGFYELPGDAIYDAKQFLYEMRIIDYIIKNYSDNKPQSIILEYILTFNNKKPEDNPVVLKIIKNEPKIVEDRDSPYDVEAQLNGIISPLSGFGDHCIISIVKDYNEKFLLLRNHVKKMFIMQEHYFSFLEKLCLYNYLLSHVTNKNNVKEYLYILKHKKHITSFVKLFKEEYPTEKSKIKNLVDLQGIYLKKISLLHSIKSKI